MAVTKETVEHLARLSRLEMSDAEKEDMVRDLERILHFVDQLKDTDLEGIEPLTFLNPNSVQRSDEAGNELDRTSALKNAPVENGVFYLVPKVIS